MARIGEGLCIASALLAVTVPANAADRHDVTIPAGRLGDAAIALGRQTGTSIGMSDQALAGLPVRSIAGRLSAGQALDRLLAGTGARAVRVNANTWRILRTRAAPDRPLPPAPSISDEPLPPVEAADAIVVTASKRRIPLGQFAGTVEMIDASLFRDDEASAGSAALIDHVTSLSSTHVGDGRNKLFIRGIADSGFAGPTQATTGQYLGDMRLNYAAPDPDLSLYDVAAVEVLEGPQGTLYGAGSLGGIIRVVPNPPDLVEFGGRIGVGASATQHGDPGADGNAVLNLPLVQGRLGLRVVGYAESAGGYIDDTLRDLDDVNRTHTYGGRAALRFVPDDAWTIDLNGLYQRIEGDDAQYASRNAGRLTRESPVAQNYLTDYWLASGRIERRWEDMTFTTTAGIVRHLVSERYDATGANEGALGPGAGIGIGALPATETPMVYHQVNRTRMITTESRLSRDLHDGLGWLVGFSYLDSRSTISRTLGPPDMPTPSTGVRNGIHEWTALAEASVQPFPALVVTVGGRLTSSKLSGVATDPMPTLVMADISRAEAQADRRETSILPSVAMMSDAISGVTLFLRYQQGFRPGGLAVDDYHVRRFRNDRIGTLEAGFRRGVPGLDLFAFTGSLAYTDWRDIQADLTDRRGLPTTANIGDGRIYTFEGRVVLSPMRGLKFDAAAIYNDSVLNQPADFVRMLSYEGRTLSLPNVANFGARVAAEYRTMIGATDELRLSASGRYVGHSRLGVGPIFGQRQGGYVDTSLSASWGRGPFRATLTVTNFLDATGNRFALGTPFDLGDDDYTPMRPRTVRAGIDFAF